MDVVRSVNFSRKIKTKCMHVEAQSKSVPAILKRLRIAELGVNIGILGCRAKFV